MAIIAARRRLLRMARELQHGIEPYAASRGEVYRVRSVSAITPERDFAKLMEHHRADAIART